MARKLSDVVPILKFFLKADIGGTGSSGSPAFVKVADESGTVHYIFGGTSGLRTHTSEPTDDGDGSLIGTVGAGEISATELASDAVTTAKILDANVTPAKYNIVEARTATADGTTTGTISATSTHVTVTSDNADKIIVLPAPVVGRTLVIHNGATGYELRSSAPATVAINGGAEADAESAIAANSTVFITCVTTTAWKAFFMDADGDVAKVQAAAAA